MEFGNWKEEYSVDNLIIDEQHKRLLYILFRLERLVNQKKGSDKMVELITQMSDYALDHFQAEERYMERIGYPHLERHSELHTRYSLEVLKFTMAHMDESPENPRAVLSFLTQWWTDHILKVDMDYAAHTKKKETQKIR